MALPFFKWSKTAASNATADPTINWAEGQAPSSVNDSARAMMASSAAYRDDTAGVIVTGGTSTAYTVTSFQVFDSLANMNSAVIAFTPHATNGATVTLNVDGLGAKPLRSAPSTELLAGTLILGTPYTALYNHTDQVFYLRGLYGNPYNVPLLGGMDFWDTVAPNSSFIFPAGQAINRTTYAAAFARWGTTYGSGDGSTTFNVPDKTGRASVMKESSATRLTSTYFGGNSTLMGATGGNEAAALTASLIPTLTSTNASQSISVSPPGGAQSIYAQGTTDSMIAVSTSGTLNYVPRNGNGFNSTGSLTGSNSISVTSTGTGGSSPSHNNVQPTIVCNYIIRII